MNKLVIIGNGFDLAHGLKTSYSDFILWHLNKVSESLKLHDTDLLVNYSCTRGCRSFQSISDFFLLTKDYNYGYKSIFKSEFYEKIVKTINQSNPKEKRWVDIEREYYKALLHIYKPYEISEKYDKADLNKLNDSFDLIKKELEEYLSSSNISKVELKDEILYHFENEIVNKVSDRFNDSTRILNFNYTGTVNLYIDKLIEKFRYPSILPGALSVNYIHGKLNEKDNPIIFGYGDETDVNYEKIEKLNDNMFLKHMKSFAYLQTPNYKNLFEFLDREDVKFEVHIMGHSCGLSDRLLFTHILEHPNLHSVKIYYYEKEDGTNDFFEKTQELSRYFRKDAKHKMRKVIVPFNESVPLVKYKSNEN